MKTSLSILLAAAFLLSLDTQTARAAALIIDFDASNIPVNTGSPGSGWTSVRTPDLQGTAGSPEFSSPQRYNFGTDYFFNTTQFDPTDPTDLLSQLNFFGGFERRYGSGTPSGGTQDLGGAFLLDDDPDRLVVGANGGGTTVVKIANGLFQWGESQFMNSGSTMGVRFDSTSTIRINKTLSSGGSALDSAEVRLVINNAGTFYVSEFSLTGTAEDVTLTDFNDNATAGKRWSLFTPTATDFDLPASYTFEAVDFQDVESVGLIFRAENDGFENFELFDFEVTGTVVPEPSSIALLCLGGGLLLWLLRRRPATVKR